MARPEGVGIVAVVLALFGIMLLGVSILLTLAGSLMGVLLLLLSWAFLYVVWGFWKLRPWAWRAMVILLGVRVVLVFVTVLTGTATWHDYFAFIVAIPIIGYLLWNKQVRAAFNRSPE
jgi:hypothetical protein